MYADDTTIYFNLEDFESHNRVNVINNELEKINVWLKVNKLTLNVDKTKCMIFHKRRMIEQINFSINNTVIDQVSQFSFLGILLDENVSWKNHITMVTNKLSKITGILYRLKYTFPKHIFITIYNSFFVPHLNYGSLVWGTKIKCLEKLQKRAIRTITHSDYIAHTEPLLKELKLLNVKDLFALKTLKFLHKFSHNELPSYFEVYRPQLTKIITPYELRVHPLPIPQVAHVYAESCLIYQLVLMLNKLRANYPLILEKIEQKTHSHAGFNKYVSTIMLEQYNFECVNTPCRTCQRK